MKLNSKISRILIPGLLLLVVSAGFLPAQIEFPQEKVFLRTERNLYISGEQVLFKLHTLDAASNKPVHYSDIVYLELLDRQHSPLIRKKYAINDGESSGSFYLPFELVSEHYYLRAYTSWMKNGGVKGYAYQLLSVLNPFEEIRPEMIFPMSEEGNDSQPPRQDDPQAELRGFEINVSGDYANIGTRQKIVLDIETKDKSDNPVQAELLISVVRKGLLNPGNQTLLIDPEQHGLISKVLYPPEWGGHFIKGNISDRIQGEPQSGDTLLYSVVGRKALLDYSISDSLGNFSFLVKNLEGQREIVIQNLNSSKSDYNISLEDPFSADFLEVELPLFHIDTSNLKQINQAVIATQIIELYKGDLSTEDRLKGSLSFYGHPEQEFILADYVRLPEMREVFFELIPTAQIRGAEDRTIIRVRNTKGGPFFQSQSLMFVDGVVVPDPMQIVELDPLRVERIQIVASEFNYGVLRFPGIVSIFTEDGRCPVSLPQYFFRQSYDFLSSDKPAVFPDYSRSFDQEDTRPDFRNTLYWDPDIRTDKNGRAMIEFYTSDDISDYVLMIQGFTRDGLGGSYSDTISITGD